MIDILFAMAIATLSSNAVAAPTSKITSCQASVQSTCKRKIVPAKLRLLKQPPKLLAGDIDEEEYSGDDQDQITIQTITSIREIKRRSIEVIPDDVAERLSMIKWIVLARLANPNLHKA